MPRNPTAKWRAAASEAQKKLWADPAHRAKMPCSVPAIDGRAYRSTTRRTLSATTVIAASSIRMKPRSMPQAAGAANRPIAEMGGSLRRQSDRFRDYKPRCMMRDHVQAACRGRLRRRDNLAVFANDDSGKLVIPECGRQLLICGIHEDAWCWKNWNEMFPGAPLPAVNGSKRELRSTAPAKNGPIRLGPGSSETCWHSQTCLRRSAHGGSNSSGA